MSLLLNVPNAEKEHAASMGAQWDQVSHTWYLPEDQYDRLIEVARWIPEKHPAIILPTEISVVQAGRPCWKCQHNNRVIALAGNYFYEKDMNERDESVWLAQDFFTVFQQVSAISDNLQTFLNDYYPRYKRAWSNTLGNYYWSNHCESCDSIQGDWFLFDEAGSVFNPTEREEAARLTIRNHTLKYAPLIDAVYSLGDHARLINEFAERADL
ncbi:hypothetical protein MRBLMN1_006116 [Chitinophaga ginsengisegetis]|uniref:DUF5710 domain-containing protein n=1 Tax=Chitinophaga ginsengisegetis TaxID=393003 RepID=UPI000DBA6E75|nr:DUF5710 domain-containing protein [Chitinophaga ginsengisegetis]MDR6566599.1 hypothetical protein [Chitinophaga ginsengisegetis]MDR6646329.1 hypothetical protein [Chitinophaga ginsengisegetis]MDR6652679.1 hypothetical protein [Chitinophaga ginsengisegetis]